LVHAANWLVTPVIQADEVAVVLHQNHDYAHISKKSGVNLWRNAGALHNIEVMTRIAEQVTKDRRDQYDDMNFALDGSQRTNTFRLLPSVKHNRIHEPDVLTTCSKINLAIGFEVENFLPSFLLLLRLSSYINTPWLVNTLTHTHTYT